MRSRMWCFLLDVSLRRTKPLLLFSQVKRDHSGVQRTELLPGDRENLAIQTRGGPEKHEVTGWVLVSTKSWQQLHSQQWTQDLAHVMGHLPQTIFLPFLGSIPGVVLPTQRREIMEELKLLCFRKK